MLKGVLQSESYEHGVFVLNCTNEVYKVSIQIMSGIQSGGGSE